MRGLIRKASALALTACLAAAVAAQPAPSDQDRTSAGPTTEAKPASKPSTFKAQSPFRVMEVMSQDLAAQPDSPGKKAVGRVAQSVLQKCAASPEKREEIAEKGIDQVTFAASSIDPQSEPPDTVRKINDAVAYLNTTAGRYDRALDVSQRAVDYDPDDRDAYVNRSMANYGLKRLDKAWSDADHAAKLDPNDADALRARAMASYGMKNYLQAIEDARRALALDPNDRTSFAIIKLSENRVPAMDMATIKSRMAGELQAEYHGMVQQLNQVAQKSSQPLPSPSAPETARFLQDAKEKFTVKDYAAAISAADQAIARNPDDPTAYYYRAAAENVLGRYEDAEADASRALILDPSDSSLRDARAWALNRLGRFRDAIADANHSLEVDPRNPYAFANRSYSYEQMGDLDTMLRDLKSAASLSPQFEPAYRDAAARHGLSTDAAAPGPPEAQVRAEREQARRKSFLTVVVSSVIGGLLIAAGFLHLASSDKPAASSRTVALSGLEFSKLANAFELGPQLGIGGMGVVFAAVDKALQRKVAIKVLRGELAGDRRDRERFLEEARTVAALHHPGIVDIHSIVEDASGVYLVFEYIEGRNLHDVLQERRRLSVAESKLILRQICQALDYAHHHGVVHRDLKPGNIMVSDQGFVKVMDFGISRHALDAAAPLSVSEKATACGTPDYMAPEQEAGQVRKEADVYSLGCLLYEMTTGRRAFPGPNCQLLKLARNYQRPSTIVDGLSPELDRVIDWALHPDPAHRVRSVRDFWALLDRVPDSGVTAPIAAS